VVEGVNLDNAIHWKETIGPIEDRRGHWDLWGYRCTDGLGMHEFLRLCEDLNADAMYVCNCGMSCQARKPEYSDDIPYWVQNALDAIEYIVGDSKTKWGSVRAQNGHPEPFKLRYVEIGNENGGEEYFERYKIFYEAIHKKYPKLELITNVRVPGAPNDIIDHHYYTSPNIFPNIYDKYIKEDQEGSKIYVGEYACICKEAGYGNLLSAISEACFMVGMEQSGNVVRIASFAPLFCNENNRNWGVNLINFDKDTVYGIPSYYVQKLFSENNPSVVFETKYDPPEDSLSRLFVSAGTKKNELIIKVVCFGPEDISADIEIRGITLAGKAEEIVIAGEKETDTNSVVSPFEVSPGVRDKALTGKGLSHTFPAYSFTVFKAALKESEKKC
jgi:alpha-L-arabinofuranosidase